MNKFITFIKKITAKILIPKTPIQCLDLIKKYEGFRTKPYYCPAGIATIGYGSTFYKTGKLVTIDDPPISEPDAASLLDYHAYTLYDSINNSTLKTLSVNQLSALVSFSYNLGIGALLGSTLLKKIREDPKQIGIRLEFQRWTKATVNGKKVNLKGLELRRKDEADLFFL